MTQLSGYPYVSSVLLCLLLWAILSLLPRKPPTSKPLPGPKPLPILGNIRDIVFERECETYAQWSKIYGDVIGLKIFGQTLVYLNSSQAVHDLFETRSSIYSDRFITQMMRLMGIEWSVVVMQYGSQWRKHRQIFQQRFHPRAAEEFWPLHAKATLRLLHNLLTDPDDYSKHFRHLGGSVLIESTYGIPVTSRDHPLLLSSDNAISAFTEISKPGAFLVDTFPLLRFVPQWFPFAYFKRRVAYWRPRLDSLRDIPWDTSKQLFNTGRSVNSFATTMMQQIEDSDATATEYDFKGAAAVTYGAGTDTILTCLESFVLAMVLYPEAQKQAQKELDAVLGGNRLPMFDDRLSLPCVEAVWKETLRWNPPVPLGIPHCLTEDDIYNGYYIPKGTIVFGNAWAILHDEKTFPDPNTFNPTRYIENPDLPDPRTYGVFGYGRRICPGRHFADALVWLAIAHILTIYNIGKPLNSDGNEVEPDVQFMSGLMHRPLPFKCRFIPRSSVSRSMISKAMEPLTITGR